MPQIPRKPWEVKKKKKKKKFKKKIKKEKKIGFPNTICYDIKWFHALVSSRYTLTSECKLCRWQREIQSVDS